MGAIQAEFIFRCKTEDCEEFGGRIDVGEDG